MCWDFSPYVPLEPTKFLATCHLFSCKFVFSFKTPFIYWLLWEKFQWSPSPGLVQLLSGSTSILTYFYHCIFCMVLLLMYEYCSHFTMTISGRVVSFVSGFSMLSILPSYPTGIQCDFVEWVKEGMQIWTFAILEKLSCEDGINIKIK